MSETPQRPLPRRSEAPRRVIGGQRLLRADGFGPWSWPAEGWLLALPASSEEEALEGLAYARSGQVATLAVSPGRIAASVQGRLPHPHAVEIQWSTIAAADAESLLHELAADSAAAAGALLGEVPRAIEPLFAARGFALAPTASDRPIARCSCGRPSGCRHEVAVAWVLQERISIDPWLLLRLRGLVREDVQDRVRLARRTAEDASAMGLAECGTPFDAPIEEFWRPGAALAQLEEMPPAHHAPMALLRRLGPSPLEGRFPLVGLLASAYETIRRCGEQLASTGDAIDLPEAACAGGEEPPAAIEVAAPKPSSVAPTNRPLGRAVAKRKTPSA